MGVFLERGSSTVPGISVGPDPIKINARFPHIHIHSGTCVPGAARGPGLPAPPGPQPQSCAYPCGSPVRAVGLVGGGVGAGWLADTHSVAGSSSFPVLLLPVGVLSQAGGASGLGRGSALRAAAESYPMRPGAKVAARSCGGGCSRQDWLSETQGIASVSRDGHQALFRGRWHAAIPGYPGALCNSSGG